jgi:hypothetical protein
MDDNGTTTWASRNPLKDVQLPRVRAPVVVHTDAEKATYDARRQLNKANTQALQAAIDVFCAERNAKIEELAKEFGKKAGYIRGLITNATHYKTTRAPSLKNALIHHKSVEVNTSKSPALLFHFLSCDSILCWL